MDCVVQQTICIDEINEVLHAPEVKRWISDDYTRGKITQRDMSHLYLKAEFDGELLGLGVFVPRGSIELEVHTAFKKKAWGMTELPTKLAINWIFDQTECKKLTGRTPANNKRAIAYNCRMGFEIEGINRKSILLNGELVDQIYFGMRKESWAQIR